MSASRSAGRSTALPVPMKISCLAAGPEQAMRAVPREQLVPSLLVDGPRGFEQRRREQPLHEVVDPPVAVPAGQAEDPRLGERLQDGADRVGRAPVPVDGGPRFEIGGRERPVAADPLQELFDERRVLVERPAIVADPVEVPGDAIPGHLGGRDDREALVVGLVEGPGAIQVLVHPVPSVSRHPGQQHEVVVPPGDVERVELEGAEPIDHREHARGLRRQGPRRRQEVAQDEQAAGGRPVEEERLGHRPDGTGDARPSAPRHPRGMMSPLARTGHHGRRDHSRSTESRCATSSCSSRSAAPSS